MGWFKNSREVAPAQLTDEQKGSFARSLIKMAQDPTLLDPATLTLAADSDSAELRILAIRAAAASCYAKAVPLCLGLLFDEDDHVIQEAIRALEIVGDASAIPHLRRLTFSDDPDIALSAIDAMRTLQGLQSQTAIAA
jgi:HEAT repeat protein